MNYSLLHFDHCYLYSRGVFMIRSKIALCLAAVSLTLGACKSRGSNSDGDETAGIAADNDKGQALYFFSYFKQFKDEKGVMDWQVCVYTIAAPDFNNRGDRVFIGEQAFATDSRATNLTADEKSPNGYYINWGTNPENKGDLKNYILNSVKGQTPEKQTLVNQIDFEAERLRDKNPNDGFVVNSGREMASNVNFIGPDIDQKVYLVMQDLIKKAKDPKNKSAMGVTNSMCPKPANAVKQKW